MREELKRCWKTNNPIHIEYHDSEWGIPLHDDQKLYEFLVLGGFQAGLTWWLILQRREILRKAFDDFDPEKVSKYKAEDIQRLMNAPGVIHNKGKISSAISNATRFLEVKKEFGSFDNYIWRFVKGRTINNSFSKLSELPSETQESAAMSNDLRKRGFKFVGPTICYAFMQATGMVNDHLIGCFRHNQVKHQH